MSDHSTPRQTTAGCWKLIVCGCIISLCTAASNRGRAFNQSEFSKLDSLFKGRFYDRRATPTQNTGRPTLVSVEMYLRSFGSIKPVEMDYTADLYLRQRWLETRFINNSLTRPLDVSDPNLMKKIWKPEVYFPNAKWGDFQYVSVPNVLIRIHPDGNVLYMLRLQLLFACMMDLTNYPLDSQQCTIELAVFSKTTRELLLSWYAEDSAPIKMYTRLKLPHFQVVRVQPDYCRSESKLGNYSCLQARFLLDRNLGYHIVQSYIPSSLIVVISWVSFWLDVDSIPSRVTLGVTTLLTICSESSGTPDRMPPVSYMKALDVWMGVCTAFIFLALLEFTLVNQLSRPRRETMAAATQMARASSRCALELHRLCGSDCVVLHLVRKKEDDITQSAAPTSTAVVLDATPQSVCIDVGAEVLEAPQQTGAELADTRHRRQRRYRASRPSTTAVAAATVTSMSTRSCRCQRRLRAAANIDRVSRVVFPLIFCTFNVFYWLRYGKF